MDDDMIHEIIPIKELRWGEGEAEGGYSLKNRFSPFTECDVIEVYCENGQMAPFVWFKVIKSGEIIARVNSAFVREVLY